MKSEIARRIEDWPGSNRFDRVLGSVTVVSAAIGAFLGWTVVGGSPDTALLVAASAAVGALIPRFLVSLFD